MSTCAALCAAGLRGAIRRLSGLRTKQARGLGDPLPLGAAE